MNTSKPESTTATFRARRAASPIIRNVGIVAGVTALSLAGLTAVSSASKSFDSACANNKNGSLRVLLNGGNCTAQEQVVGLGAAAAASATRVEYPEVTVEGRAGMSGPQAGFIACPAGTKPVSLVVLPGGTAGSNNSSFIPEPSRNGMSFNWFHDHYRQESSLTLRAVCIG